MNIIQKEIILQNRYLISNVLCNVMWPTMQRTMNTSIPIDCLIIVDGLSFLIIVECRRNSVSENTCVRSCLRLTDWLSEAQHIWAGHPRLWSSARDGCYVPTSPPWALCNGKVQPEEERRRWQEGRKTCATRRSRSMTSSNKAMDHRTQLHT